MNEKAFLKQTIEQPQDSVELQESRDWNGLVRWSFAFSQGDAGVQKAILQWLAAKTVVGKESIKKSLPGVAVHVETYTKSISKDSQNHSLLENKDFRSIQRTVDETLYALKQELNSANSVSEDDRKSLAARALNDIAVGFIERDKKYLLGSEGVGSGRPISPDSKRDEWSSFIIDFGVLNKGDGFFTWKGTPDEFKKLWNEVIVLIKEKYPEEYTSIADVYMITHPSLPAEDVEKILAT